MGALPKLTVPTYLKRGGFNPEEFGDGGAFPEIHYVQYPLAMGRRSSNNPKTLPLIVDDGGNPRYDTIVMQGENANKIVFAQYTDLVPIFAKDGGEKEDMDVVHEKQKEIDETTQETKAALEKIVNVRLSCAEPKNVPQRSSSQSKFIKYKPSGAKQRIIRMVEMGVDPLEPPKFKHKRVPKPWGSQPVPVMQSPPRAVTVKDQQDWKIPPCISNWKNPKGYTIPLDKRLAADGRGLQDVEINGNFAMLSEALYVGEQISREAVAARSKVQKEMVMKEKERKDLELRELARKARSDRRTTGVGDYESKEENEEKLCREEIREERRKERERAKDAAAIGMGKKSKTSRDRERDMSEKVALGMANTGSVMYDERLFNQEKGMDSGFARDDAYNVYEKGLFSTQSALNSLYKPKKDAAATDDMYGINGGADEQLKKLKKTERFKVDRHFSCTSERATRPLEFNKEEEEDLFGLNQFMGQIHKGGR